MSIARDLTPEDQTKADPSSSVDHDDQQGPFDPERIRAQVARILTSPEFEKSHQLRRFLEFVVEETLAGRGDQIKQYTVAIKAFGRPAHFDPRADPIVRIEARRLRRSLNRYYQLYGAADPIIIEIPTGAYVPRFRPNVSAEQPSEPASAFRPAVPTLLLMPFETRLNDEDERFLADSLGEELAIALHRFHHLQVIGPIPRTIEEIGPRTIARHYGADFLLAGRIIHLTNRMKIVVRLLDGSTGRLLWSETYASQSDENLGQFEEDVVARTAATLLDTYGIIPRMFLRRVTHLPGETFHVYQAILQYSRYLISEMGRPLDDTIHALEKAVDIAPQYALVKALLGDLYTMKYELDGEEDVLARAEILTREALRLDPQCRYAYFVRAFVARFRRQIDLFIQQIRKAVRLNAHNPLVLATAGFHLGVVGEWEEGFRLIHDAMQLNPNYPGWYHGLAFLDAYRHGQFEEAFILAKRINNPTLYWDPLLRAAALGQLGRRADAEEALRELLKLRPDFITVGRELMTRTLFADDLVEMLMEGLVKAGLGKGTGISSGEPDANKPPHVERLGDV